MERLGLSPHSSVVHKRCARGDGMGSVYRAVDTRLGRKVAIKICAQQFTGRFEREARAISSLNHPPHICTLYDVGANYLVMELVERRSPLAFKKGGCRWLRCCAMPPRSPTRWPRLTRWASFTVT